MKLKNFFKISNNGNEREASIYINGRSITESISKLMKEKKYAEAQIKRILPYPISEELFGLDIEVEYYKGL